MSFIALRRYGFVTQNRRAVNNRPYGFLRYNSLNSNLQICQMQAPSFSIPRHKMTRWAFVPTGSLQSDL